jgi:hypothetical protein
LSITAGLVLALIITLLLHLVEEIKTGFRRRLPIAVMPKSVFIGINIGLYTYCFITLFLVLIGNAFAIPFTWVFALAMLINGLGHIGIMAVRRRYFPGGLTAFLLVFVASYLIIYLLKI